MKAIDVRGLNKAFDGKPIVRNLDLSINLGEIFAFLGPNGSGKTTTMRMISGLLTADSGEGTCFGLDVRRDHEEIRYQIGYMSQYFSLYEDLTVEENLIFTARAYGVSHVKAEVEKMISRFSLQTYAKQLSGTLSGGWKQRLSLACALLHEPKLLMLDEPTSGVDPESRNFFWDAIQAEAAAGITVMVSTHYLDEVMQYANRLAYILRGSLLVHGSPLEVIQNSGLKALRISQGKHNLLQAARNHPAVLYATLTTDGLLLIGEGAGELERIANDIAPDYAIETVQPRLEEVFLHLARGQS